MLPPRRINAPRPKGPGWLLINIISELFMFIHRGCSFIKLIVLIMEGFCHDSSHFFSPTFVWVYLAKAENIHWKLVTTVILTWQKSQEVCEGMNGKSMGVSHSRW